MASVWELPGQPLREAAQGVSASFEPITNSARRAVDLFMREMAPSDTEGKPGT